MNPYHPLALGFASALSLLSLSTSNAFDSGRSPPSAEARAAPAKSVAIVLTPHQSGGGVDYVKVKMVLGSPNGRPGDDLIDLPLVVASIPTQRYDGEALRAQDAQGELPLVQTDARPTAFITNRSWSTTRPTAGDVVLTFKAIPRAVDAKTQPGPLFDLRAEAGGVNESGYTFLPIPPGTASIPLQLHWDLSHMPPGSRGVWSLGEGDVSMTAPADVIQHSYYMAGPITSIPSKADGLFGMYWLSRPSFDASDIAVTIQRMFSYMASYFKDDGSPYRVFVRKQPYHGDGGTALTRSFMFGWSADSRPSEDHIEGLLAHEMVHNWPRLDGDHAATSWYSEGTAEYYSILLPFKAGLSTTDQFLSRINDRAGQYYRNPLQSLSNAAAEEIYWRDPRASHVPYGRGFMYLANVDYEIRKASSGSRSLRDVVLAIRARQDRHEAAGIPEWLDLVRAQIGPKANAEYAAMASGRKIVPNPNVFGPCFRPVRYSEGPVDFGFDVFALKGSGSKVAGLAAGSSAAKAGLRDGDEIQSAPDFRTAETEAAQSITLLVKRGDGNHTISYRPRGAAADAWRFERVRGAADSACDL